MTKLLIVDDEDNIRHLLRVAFEDEFEVEVAADGVEAFEKALKWSPDLIVSDIMMPKLDGYGLYRKLKARPETSSIPFVFLSAKKDVEEKVVGLEMGADDYITKPFSIKELKAKIKSIIKKFEEIQDRGSLEGSLKEVDLVEVIQLIEMGRKTGMLTLETNIYTGHLYFRQGEPIYAQAGKWSGIDAFFTMFSWGEGRFRFTQQPLEMNENIDANRGQELLMEGVRLMDEMEEALRHMPTFDTELIIASGKNIPEGEAGVLLENFKNGEIIKRVVANSDIPPYRIYPMVADALVTGYLEEASGRSDRLEVLRRLRASLEVQ